MAARKILAHTGPPELQKTKISVIIDINGFDGPDGFLIPKEVAITALEFPFIEHWIVESPHCYFDLCLELRTLGKWKMFTHGIPWDKKGLTKSETYKRIAKIVRLSTRVYTYRHDVSELVTFITGCDTIDIGKFETQIEAMPLVQEYCMYHGLDLKRKYDCAYNSVTKLKNWLVVSPEIDPTSAGNSKKDTSASTVTYSTPKAVRKVDLDYVEMKDFHSPHTAKRASLPFMETNELIKKQQVFSLKKNKKITQKQDYQNLQPVLKEQKRSFISLFTSMLLVFLLTPILAIMT